MAVAGAWCFLGEESELSSVSHPSSRPVSGSASEASSILVPERMSEKAPHVLARWTAERSRSVVTFWDSKENFAPIFRFYCGCEAKHNDSEKLAVPHSAKNGGFLRISARTSCHAWCEIGHRAGVGLSRGKGSRK